MDFLNNCLPSKNEIDQAVRLVDYLYQVSSDRSLPAEELDVKAKAWLTLLSASIFDKYLRYKIRACCLSRTWRGPITADEFLRVSTQVRLGKVWHTEKREWVEEQEIIEKLLNVSIERADRFRQAQEAADVEALAAIFDECRALIYGWENGG